MSQPRAALKRQRVTAKRQRKAAKRRRFLKRGYKPSTPREYRFPRHQAVIYTPDWGGIVKRVLKPAAGE